MIFKLIIQNGNFGTGCEIALWMLQILTDAKSTLVHVMAWCHEATGHSLSQCWPRLWRHMASLGHNELNIAKYRRKILHSSPQRWNLECLFCEFKVLSVYCFHYCFILSTIMLYLIAYKQNSAVLMLFCSMIIQFLAHSNVSAYHSLSGFWWGIFSLLGQAQWYLLLKALLICLIDHHWIIYGW